MTIAYSITVLAILVLAEVFIKTRRREAKKPPTYIVAKAIRGKDYEGI